MSVNVYNKSSDSLNPIAGRTPDDKVSKSNVLNTLEEISASTNPLDVAGASAVRELSSELGGFTPVIDESGKITGYKTTIGGADTVFPFSSSSSFYDKTNKTIQLSRSSLTLDPGKYLIVAATYVDGNFTTWNVSCDAPIKKELAYLNKKESTYSSYCYYCAVVESESTITASIVTSGATIGSNGQFGPIIGAIDVSNYSFNFYESEVDVSSLAINSKISLNKGKYFYILGGCSNCTVDIKTSGLTALSTLNIYHIAKNGFSSGYNSSWIDTGIISCNTDTMEVYPFENRTQSGSWGGRYFIVTLKVG